jgi:thiamine-phosphate pyrophosphorylase
MPHPSGQEDAVNSFEANSKMDSTPSLLRILDVNANRAAEGLRVIEDHLRFTREDALLAEQAKRLRHQLVDTLSFVPTESLVLARDAGGDVGRTLDGPREFDRSSSEAVVRANFKRSQQALRNLEEWSKMANGQAARRFKSLRYALYELETAATCTDWAERQLRAVQLCVLIDGGTSEADFVHRVGSLIQAGVPMLQLRAKQLDDRTTIERGRRLMELVQGHSTLVVVNDRPDLAVAVQSHGVHLGQDDMPAGLARRIVGPERLIGISTHSIEQARAAVLQGASYLGVGPVFESSTKSFDHFPGLELLRHVAAEIRLPAFAIGGIDPTRLQDVLACGIARVAIGAAIWQVASPGEACTGLLRGLVQGGEGASAAIADRGCTIDRAEGPQP